MKGHNSVSYLWKFESNTPNGFGEILFYKLEILQRVYGSLNFLLHSNFAVFDGWYFLQCCLQRAEIAQFAQVNQVFQFLHLVYIYGHRFYEFDRILIRKNVNNDFSKDSPIVSQGPEEMCLSLENQNPSKPLKKWVILKALQFRYTFYRPPLRAKCRAPARIWLVVIDFQKVDLGQISSEEIVYSRFIKIALG